MPVGRWLDVHFAKGFLNLCSAKALKIKKYMPVGTVLSFQHGMKVKYSLNSWYKKPFRFKFFCKSFSIYCKLNV